MDLNNTQLWNEDLSSTFHVDNEKSCRKLVNILQQSHIDHFNMEASFMQEYQLDEFTKQWQLQFEPNEANEYKGFKTKKYFLQRPKDYPNEFIMELGQELIRGHIFMDIYKNELEQMRDEYQIKFSTNGYRLYIFMREGQDLNMICKQRLLDMSYSLKLFYGHEPNLIIVFNVSFMLRKKLNEKGVNVRFKKIKGAFMSIFFSTTLDIPKMIMAIQQLSQFDLSIFNFHHQSISETEAMSVRQVAKNILSMDIQRLQEEYEIQIEFSQDNTYVVFHACHAIFGAEPSFVFQQRLNNLVILSVKSRNIKDFDNKMRKLIKVSPFASEIMNKSRNETYLVIDLSRIYRNNQIDKHISKKVEQFLKLFAILIQPNFEIKIYFTHIAGNLSNLYKHIVELSEQNHLVLLNEQFHNCSDRKAIFKLRDCSENTILKRQKQLLLFLQGLITPFSGKSNETVSFIDESSLDQLKASVNNSISHGSSSLDAIIQQKYTIPWLRMTFLVPKQKDFGQEDRDFLKDRRNRAIEQLFNTQSASNVKFRVWSLQLSRKIQICEQKIVPQPYLLKSAVEGMKLKDHYDLSILSSFKAREQGLIAFLTNQIAVPFIPLYIFQRIQ